MAHEVRDHRCARGQRVMSPVCVCWLCLCLCGWLPTPSLLTGGWPHSPPLAATSCTLAVASCLLASCDTSSPLHPLPLSLSLIVAHVAFPPLPDWAVSARHLLETAKQLGKLKPPPPCLACAQKVQRKVQQDGRRRRST